MEDYKTMERLEIGETIYFIGYGIVEALKVVKITTEETEEAFIGYVDARRPDGTVECLGFNTLGELVFTNKEEAKKSLSTEVSLSLEVSDDLGNKR
jgi:hypothetical protein